MERWRVARSLHSRQPVPRVGRQEPSQVLGFDYRRAVRKRPAKILPQTGAHVAGEGPRRFQPVEKRLLRLGKAEGLQLYGVALRVLSHQHKVAGVGDQHEPVTTPVAAHLVAVRRQPGVVPGGLDLHNAAFGDLPGAGLSLLHLPSRVEAEVRVARALLGKLAYAEHLGTERAAYGVQQVGQRRVVRSLSSRAAGRPYAAEVGEVLLDCRGQLGCGCWHSPILRHSRVGLHPRASYRLPQRQLTAKTRCQEKLGLLSKPTYSQCCAETIHTGGTTREGRAQSHLRRLETVIEARVALPLVDMSDPTSLYPNGRPTSTSMSRCHCAAPMSAPGLSTLCSHCSRFGCRNATQWRRFKARASCRPCGHAIAGSRVRDAVAGIYESRSLSSKTPST